MKKKLYSFLLGVILIANFNSVHAVSEETKNEWVKITTEDKVNLPEGQVENQYVSETEEESVEDENGVRKEYLTNEETKKELEERKVYEEYIPDTVKPIKESEVHEEFVGEDAQKNTQNSSIQVDNNAKININKEEDLEKLLHTVTFVSKFDGKDVLGSQYKLINVLTKEEILIDFTEKGEVVVEGLKKGSYILQLVKEAEGYVKTTDISFNLPYKILDEPYTVSTSLRVFIKHIKKLPPPKIVIPPDKPKPNPDTGDGFNQEITLVGLGLSVTALVGLHIYGKKSKKEVTQ